MTTEPDARLDVLAVLSQPGQLTHVLGDLSDTASVRAFTEAFQQLVDDIHARLDAGDPHPLADAIDDLTERVVTDALADL